MYIWPDGSTTGSVNHAVLEEYQSAKKNGEDLSRFAPFLAESSSEAALAAGPAGITGQSSPAAPAQEQAPAEDDVYDPADHTVAEVNEYLASASPEEASRVLDAELAGKARSTLLGPREEE